MTTALAGHCFLCTLAVWDTIVHAIGAGKTPRHFGLADISGEFLKAFASEPWDSAGAELQFG